MKQHLIEFTKNVQINIRQSAGKNEKVQTNVGVVKGTVMRVYIKPFVKAKVEQCDLLFEDESEGLAVKYDDFMFVDDGPFPE